MTDKKCQKNCTEHEYHCGTCFQEVSFSPANYSSRPYDIPNICTNCFPLSKSEIVYAEQAAEDAGKPDSELSEGAKKSFERSKKLGRMLENYFADKKLSNLERIRLAWSWGWSANIQLIEKIGLRNPPPSPVVNIIQNNGSVDLMRLRDGQYINCDDQGGTVQEIKIVNYLYAGQLAGSEPIPEGQRFRIKETGKILDRISSETKDRVSFYRIVNGRKAVIAYDKSEIEPFFE